MVLSLITTLKFEEDLFCRVLNSIKERPISVQKGRPIDRDGLNIREEVF